MAWDQLRSTYDTVAAKYEHRFLDELDDKPRDRELLAAFAARSSDPVLEIGCGPGQIGSFVAQHGRRVIGLDLSVPMATRASRRLGHAVVADMRALPFVPAAVGGVLAFYSLIHVRRSQAHQLLREFTRVLRPGAPVLLAVHEGKGELSYETFIDEPVPIVATLFTLDELVAASEQAGLEVTSAERRDPYSWERTARIYVNAQRPEAT